MSDAKFWKRKLAAYLHDPPEKAYDYSPEHGKRARHYAERIGVNLSEWQDKLADYTAAAADRFIFPAAKRKEGDHWVDTGAPGLGGGVQFVHPFTGTEVAADFPTEDETLGFCRDGFPDFAGITDPQLRFWQIWRLWRHYTMDQEKAKKYALGLGGLPADTRIPDGTIWHHDAVVSALESARDSQGGFAPAFLLFQIGPVQEFIAQARSTRDLWSGSYLVSWMMAQAMKLVADKFGPDVIIFPSLRGQPLYDWLEQEKLKLAKYLTAEGKPSASFWEENGLDRNQDLALTPNFPNRFLSVVPADFEPKEIEKVFCADEWDTERPEEELSEWARIVRASWLFLEASADLPAGARTLWDYQVRHFWQVTWQLWPWQDIQKTMTAFAGIPLGGTAPLRLGHDTVLAIPDAQKDARCYTNELKEIRNAGWAWSAHYQLLSHRLDARRQTRDFAAGQTGAKPAHKDHFSGKEEVIATCGWLQTARKKPAICHLFRHEDELGAVNLIKRVWHKAYLERKRCFRAPEFKFDSVLAIAAAPWKAQVFGALEQDEGVWAALLAFKEAVEKAKAILDFELPGTQDEGNWFKQVDASVLFESFWSSLKLDDTVEEKLRATALASLSSLLKVAKAGQPGKYYAVLALDGDQIGKWLSGEKTPAIKQVLSAKAVKYFREQVKGVDVEKWLESARPLSPSYHLQFSEALANFGLYCARRIVEAHHGQLIYSGGDDVLAMLPADEAIAGAQGLRLAFQGSPKLAEKYPGLFAPTPAGFVKLADGEWKQGCRRPSEPSWPMLVPGPKATVSVGLAIGHVKEPLQDMIQEAQAAEKRAKARPEMQNWNRKEGKLKWSINNGWNRDALAVTLYKRSGETVEWGAKFESKAFDLLKKFQQHYRAPVVQPNIEMPVSGKLPYRLTEMLAKFGSQARVDDGLCQVALAEIKWVIGQQTRKAHGVETDEELKQLRDDLHEHCRSYLEELRVFKWHNSDANEERKCPRPLSEFYHLFAIEAFIARQGE